MDINKSLILVILWFLPFNLIVAQKKSVLHVDVKDFPQVELEFNYRNPDPLDSSKIKILENDKSVTEFTLEQKQVKNEFTGKQILILIENSYWQRFDIQLNQVKELWSDIAGKVINKEDEVFVASFDWTQGAKTIQVLNEQGINSPSQVNEMIQSINAPPEDGRKHKSTEIYPALLEGISFLKNQEKNDSVAQSILLFSSEFNNIYNNTQTKTDVIISARNSGIPIYAFRYPYSEKYNLRDIAESTYGHQINMPDAGNDEVIKWINQIPQRYAGNNYILHFDSPVEANNDFRDIEIVVSGEESIKLRYQSPSKWIVIWKNRAYRYSIIAFGVLLIGIIIGLFYFLKKRRKKQVEHVERIKEDTESAIHQSELKRERENRLEEEKELNKQKEAFNKTLQTHFNRLPRPAKLMSSDGIDVEILKPVFYIGRRAENDLSLNSSAVSKVHAIIYYDHAPEVLELLNEKRFVFIDFDSTNGTFVNGNRIPSISEVKSGAKPHRLKDSDLIQMGDASITFMD